MITTSPCAASKPTFKASAYKIVPAALNAIKTGNPAHAFPDESLSITKATKVVNALFAATEAIYDC